jgi:hypothetical protein
MRNDLATDDMAVTDEIAVFGTHPYKRSHGLATGLCDSLTRKRQSRTGSTSLVVVDRADFLDSIGAHPRGTHAARTEAEARLLTAVEAAGV